VNKLFLNFMFVFIPLYRCADEVCIYKSGKKFEKN